MKKRFLFLSLLCVLSATSCQDRPHETIDQPTSTTDDVEYASGVYSNPLYVATSGGVEYKDEIADPSVIRDPDTGYFYAFATDRKILFSEDGCSFQVYATGDKVIDFPTWGQEVRPNKSVNIWAPDVQKIGNTWYYFYSLSGWGSCCGVGYGISDNPGGPYKDQGKLFSYLEIGIENAIDPNVIQEEATGDLYMTVGSFQGDYIVQLVQNDDQTISLYKGLEYQASNKVLIAGKASAWDGSQYEGGYIIYREGYYYYFGSTGTCCAGQKSSYHVMVGKSETVTGPYYDSKGYKLTMSGSGQTRGEVVVWGGGANNEDIAGPGHNSVVKDDAGDYWIYYHSFSSKDSFGTRHLFMDKLLWDENGYPYVEGKQPSFEVEKDGPRLK